MGEVRSDSWQDRGVETLSGKKYSTERAVRMKAPQNDRLGVDKPPPPQHEAALTATDPTRTVISEGSKAASAEKSEAEEFQQMLEEEKKQEKIARFEKYKQMQAKGHFLAFLYTANPANAFLQITQDQPVKPLKSSELQAFDRVLAVKDIRTKQVQLLHSAPRQTVEETVINKDHWWPPVPDEAQPAKVVGSKFAQVKLLELVAAENPGIYVASVHPGFVETAMFRKSGYQANAYPMDTG
ncbi:MAG: hypothetical protein Q9199_001543 [Rusavskia elegans]